MRKPKRNYKSGKHTPTTMDNCQTPAYALDPLLPFLNLFWPKPVIWEPACGEGYLVAALRDAGCQVVGSDILTGQDFFSYEPDEWDILITNPPYGISVKYPWIERCFKLGKPFALLVTGETICALSAQIHMEKYGAEVMLLDHRIHYKMPFKQSWEDSNAHFPSIWLCHGILPSPLVYGHIEYRSFPALPSFEAMSCVPRQLALIEWEKPYGKNHYHRSK